MMAIYDFEVAKKCIQDEWDKSVIETLKKYIRIPNQSPEFDPSRAHLAEAAHLLKDWAISLNLKGTKVHYYDDDGRTPLILIEVSATKPPSDSVSVLLYGHLDKQPPLEGQWTEPAKGPYLN